LGNVYTLKISGGDTHGIYSVWEIQVDPNSGPPLHKHSKEDEAFYVLEGIFSFSDGIEETKADKGQFIYLPRGKFHTFKNIDSMSGKLLVIINPPRFEGFFQEIGIPIDSKLSFQPPRITSSMIETVVKTGARYGLEIKI
jgi:mannose-6-phosphate isomerase-like protein (cupin superfamily)